jgi:hypothetical protein
VRRFAPFAFTCFFSLTLPRINPGDARDRRGMALEVERTPALPDLLYARGLPVPNCSVQDGGSVRREILKRPPHRGHSC